MLEPSQKDIKDIRQLELEREADATAAFYAIFLAVADKLPPIIQRALEGFGALRGIGVQDAQKVAVEGVERSFEDARRRVIMARNASMLEQRFLFEKTLGVAVEWKPRPEWRDIPMTRDYDITRRVLGSRSVNIRSKALARKIAKIIKEGQEQGESIPQVTRKVEVELGVRDKQGKRVFLKKADILKGAPVPRNGMLYQVVRIARTEMMRVASLESHDAFSEMQKRNPDARLKLRAVIDSRTRLQSIQMDGQVSDKQGRFKYPNGRYYKLGEAPARWSINDRETQYPIFLDAEKGDGIEYSNVSEYLQTKQLDLTQQRF